MGVRVVIPNMSKTFGALHYAGEGEAVTWNIYGAVSYTHLDVYKRQYYKYKNNKENNMKQC